MIMHREKNRNLSDDGFIRRLYFKTFVASALAISGNMLSRTLTTAIAGRLLGSAALSSISIALPVYYAFATAGALIGVGGAALLAGKLGEGDLKGARETISLIFVSVIVIGAILGVFFFIFADRAAALAGANAATWNMAATYIRWSAVGGFLMIAAYPVFHILILFGKHIFAPVLFLLNAGLAALLCLAAIHFGFGIAGVAAASWIAIGIAAIIGLCYLLREGGEFGFGRLHRIGKQTLALTRLGLPGAVENICVLLRSLYLNHALIAAFGLYALPAYKIIDNVDGLSLIFVSGAAGSLIPFIGIFSAEEDSQGIAHAIASAFRQGLLAIIIFVAVCLLFPEAICRFFGVTAEAEILFAIPAVRLFSLSILLYFFNNILVTVFQTQGYVIRATVLTIIRSLLGVVVFSSLLAGVLGQNGIWISFFCAEALCLLCAAVISLWYRMRDPLLSPFFLIDRKLETAGKFISLSIRNNPVDIVDQAYGLIEFGEQNGLDDMTQTAISLSVEELLLLVREHALKDDESKTIDARLLVSKDVVTLRLRYAGLRFNPFDLAEQENGEFSEDTLGLTMVMSLAETEYKNAIGVNNLVIRIKINDN
jgi:Na+-driven multidrug efflux pump/anti-sigma regulatory factor (Ser/Thr protein kinase)